MDRKLQIFISSTYKDLIEERQAAVGAILKAGHIPAGMELFRAGDTSQWETIKRWIDESDVYMLILGGRYGSVEPISGKSYTQLEFEYAEEMKKPLFSVVITDEFLERKVRSSGTEVIEREKGAELAQFRNTVLSKMCAFFSDLKDIKLAVHETIPDLLQRYKCTGWVSGKMLDEAEIALEEAIRLRDENKNLKQENKELTLKLEKEKQTRSNSRFMDNSEAELIKASLEKITLEIPSNIEWVDKNGYHIGSLNLLVIFSVVKDKLAIGVYNNMGMSDLDKFIYFDVAPKLQILGLSTTEKVNGVQYRRAYLTKSGEQFLAYMHTQPEFVKLTPASSATPEVPIKPKGRRSSPKSPN